MKVIPNNSYHVRYSHRRQHKCTFYQTWHTMNEYMKCNANHQASLHLNLTSTIVNIIIYSLHIQDDISAAVTQVAGLLNSISRGLPPQHWMHTISYWLPSPHISDRCQRSAIPQQNPGSGRGYFLQFHFTVPEIVLIFSFFFCSLCKDCTEKAKRLQSVSVTSLQWYYKSRLKTHICVSG